jgi:hypothetical protein
MAGRPSDGAATEAAVSLSLPGHLEGRGRSTSGIASVPTSPVSQILWTSKSDSYGSPSQVLQSRSP